MKTIVMQSTLDNPKSLKNKNFNDLTMDPNGTWEVNETECGTKYYTEVLEETQVNTCVAAEKETLNNN